MISLAVPGLIRIGEGALDQLQDVLDLLGVKRPLLVVDPHFRGSAVLERAEDALRAAARETAHFFGVVPDPTTASMEQGRDLARGHAADAVVAIGGGSAIDTGKGIALLAAHAVNMADLRAPHRVTRRGLPLVAVPTTAGTGSETTRFCLVTDSATGEKMACIGEGLVPAAALIDYTLTLTVPARVTADTGIDAFTHALEAYVGRKANPVSDLYAEKAMALIAHALPTLVDDLSNRQARADMMLGSHLAGTAFTNSGLCLAHAMSAPLGGTFHIPHGLSIGLLLPAVTRFSIGKAPRPYASVSRFLGIGQSKDDGTAAADFMAWLDRLVERLALPSLSDLGVQRDEYAAAVEKMVLETPRSGAAANSPAVPNHAETVALFHKVWA